MARLSLIVARARNGVIGRGNSLPWHIPEELKYFKATTMGHVLIMGRKTFDSIGRPLPGRQTIVVTRDPGRSFADTGCHRAGSLEEALKIAGDLNAAEVFVAGGAQMYALALPVADRLLITDVHLSPDGDVYFPAPDPHIWRRVASREHTSNNGIVYEPTEWQRVDRC